MRYQIQNLKETNSVEFKFTVDGTVEKTKLSVYEDGRNKAFLKEMKEFLNYVETYGIWDEENAARTVFQNFRRCLAGAARDLWDRINVIEEEDEVRDELTFDNHFKELTSAILGDDALKNQTDIRRFVSMVNFYCDLYPQGATTLVPLTDLCRQKMKFIWTQEKELAFQKMKDIMVQHTMLTYLQFDKPFVIYTDASKQQLGGVVTQDNKPLSFFSKKLTETQCRYPITKQELLAITETLK
jgi:hypothetical protein